MGFIQKGRMECEMTKRRVLRFDQITKMLELISLKLKINTCKTV